MPTANIFSDARGAPSAAFGHFIAGLQATLAEFTALLAPNVNAYQRLAQPCASPNNACWAYDNRAAGLRIPASAPVDRRVENRLPGADANPYLALAASLGAGLHGLLAGRPPGPPVQGQFAVPEALRLPTGMGEALHRLAHSQVAEALFGRELIDGYLACKQLELADFLAEITPWKSVAHSRRSGLNACARHGPGRLCTGHRRGPACWRTAWRDCAINLTVAALLGLLRALSGCAIFVRRSFRPSEALPFQPND